MFYYTFCKIEVTFNLFARSRANLDESSDRESLSLSSGKLPLDNYEKLQRGKRKNECAEESDIRDKKEETENEGGVGDAVNQLTNYCPLLISSNHSFLFLSLSLSEVYMFCQAILRPSDISCPSSESRRAVRLIESNHPRNDIGLPRAPSYVALSSPTCSRSRDGQSFGS